MFYKSIVFSKNSKLDFLIKLCIGVLSICIIAPFTWEVSETVKVMFGSLMICIIPAVFGWRIGGLAALIYVILGAIGLPVFAGHQGGIHYFIPTFSQGHSQATGYLYGYVMAAFLLGFLAEKLESIQIIKSLGLFVLAHIIILGLGFWHISQIPGSDFKLLPELKSLFPSFCIKAGLFLILLQMIDRRVNYDKIHGRTEIE